MSHKIQIRLCNFSHSFDHPYVMPHDEHQNQYVNKHIWCYWKWGLADLIGQRIYSFDTPKATMWNFFIPVNFHTFKNKRGFIWGKYGFVPDSSHLFGQGCHFVVSIIGPTLTNDVGWLNGRHFADCPTVGSIISPRSPAFAKVTRS